MKERSHLSRSRGVRARKRISKATPRKIRAKSMMVSGA